MLLFLIAPAKSLDYDSSVPEALPATRARVEGPFGGAARFA